MKLVKLLFVVAEFCRTLSDYDRLRNTIKIPETGIYVFSEQRVYASHEFGTEKKMMNSFAPIIGESDEKKEIWVRIVLMLCRYVVREIRKALKWHPYSKWSAYFL